ncbi:response regulator [Maritalea sp.]|uniref:response regulator n=1 Tax=Maritalea sp. TaxID=2003361 RepID=UPI003EF7C094
MGFTTVNMSQIKVVLVDDNVDEIFLTQRSIIKSCVVGDFIAERNSPNLINLLETLATDEDELDRIVILMDINMPRQDGFETLRKVRDHPEFADIPVFMYSSSHAESDKTKAAELGSDGYLSKPIDPAAFFKSCAENPNLAKFMSA